LVFQIINKKKQLSRVPTYTGKKLIDISFELSAVQPRPSGRLTSVFEMGTGVPPYFGRLIIY